MSYFQSIFFDFFCIDKSFYLTNGQETSFNNKLYSSSCLRVTKVSEGLGFAGISMDITCSKDSEIVIYLESLEDISSVSLVAVTYSNVIFFRGNLFYVNVSEDNGYLVFASSVSFLDM